MSSTIFAPIAAIETAAAADPGMASLTWSIEGGAVHATATVPNRFGSAVARPEISLSAEWLAQAMRQTRLPLSTVLLTGIAQEAAVRQVRNDIGCRDAEADRLRTEKLERAIANSQRRVLEAEAEGRRHVDEIQSRLDAAQRETARFQADLAASLDENKGLREQVSRLTAAERAREQAEAAKAAAAAREKALDGMYSFPEAGEGKWRLRDILAAFKAARADIPSRDLRRQDDRVLLGNPRLVREVRGYGQKISTGRGANAYRMYFAPELVARAVETLRAQQGG